MDSSLFLTALLSSIGFLFCQQNPTITYITKEQVADIGHTVELGCAVQNAEDYPVVWVKSDQDNTANNLFLSIGSTLVIPNQRFSIRHHERTSSYFLQITKLQETDAGIYQCQIIISPTNQVTADVQVHVKYRPVISGNSTRSVITSAGATVTLRCYATGYPPPRITWRRKPGVLMPSGRLLYRQNVVSIHNITKDDRGAYYCLAENGVGPRLRRKVVVEVEFAPVIVVDSPRHGQVLHQDIDLRCHVEAFPPASIIWLKDGIQLEDNQRYNITIYNDDDDVDDVVTHTSLRIESIENTEYGNYTCMATNKLGSDEKQIELFETVNATYPPDSELDQNNDMDSSTVLPVIENSDRLSPIAEMLDEVIT